MAEGFGAGIDIRFEEWSINSDIYYGIQSRYSAS